MKGHQQGKSSLAAAYDLPDFVPVVPAVPAAFDPRRGITYILPPTDQLETKGLDGYIPATALKPLMDDFAEFLAHRLAASENAPRGGSDA